MTQSTEQFLPDQNVAHPLADVLITPSDRAAIDTAMQGIQERRAELDQPPRELFSGVVPGEGDTSRLLVIDQNDSRDNPYVVRTARLADLAAGDPLVEEPISRERATDYRGPEQIITSEVLGSIFTGHHSPKTDLERERAATSPNGMVSFAQIRDELGNPVNAVALEDAFAPVTEGHQREAARRELDLDVDTLRAQYPNLSGRAAHDARYAVLPYVEAVGSEQLSESDRRHLVEVGRKVMEAANNNPERVGTKTVLDPAEAEHVAYAEDEQRNRPPVSGGFGRAKRQGMRDLETSVALRNAQGAYRASLREQQQ
jgi:hypothetical protein